MTTLSTPIGLICPPRVEFGVGAISRLGAWAATEGYERILVVADAFNAARVGGLDLPGRVAVFGDVQPEPDTDNLAAALAIAAAETPDLVVGFGGGSAMDLAKLVAVLGDARQAFRDVVGAGKVTGPRRAALAQVPTTAGTGSEAGIRALVTDPPPARSWRSRASTCWPISPSSTPASP